MSNIRTAFNELAARGEASAASQGGQCPPALRTVLRDLELLLPGESPATAVVSTSGTAEVVAVDLAWGRVAVKSALPAGEPGAAERAATEAAWLRLVREIAAESVPALLGEHAGAAAVVLDWLDPTRAPAWSDRLLAGNAGPPVAAAVGHLYGRLHAATVGRPAFADRFAAEHAFRSLAVDAQFRDTALLHPDCAEPLRQAADTATRLRLALVHGAAATENILVGPRGPILLDGDCARYGDPAYDVASLAASLMLHAARAGGAQPARAAVEAFLTTYLQHVTWEMPELLATRAAGLLPGMLLGGVDGRAPAAFIVNQYDANRVRRVARSLLLGPPLDLETIRTAWFREFTA